MLGIAPMPVPEAAEAAEAAVPRDHDLRVLHLPVWALRQLPALKLLLAS